MSIAINVYVNKLLFLQNIAFISNILGACYHVQIYIKFENIQPNCDTVIQDRFEKNIIRNHFTSAIQYTLV